MSQTLTKIIILLCPLEDSSRLTDFVVAWLAEGVELIATVGDGCEAVHDLVDDILIGDGSDETRVITTTWHENQALSDVIEFVSTFGETERSIRQVRL